MKAIDQEPRLTSCTPEASQIVAGGPQTTGSPVDINPHAEGVQEFGHPPESVGKIDKLSSSVDLGTATK